MKRTQLGSMTPLGLTYEVSAVDNEIAVVEVVNHRHQTTNEVYLTRDRARELRDWLNNWLYETRPETSGFLTSADIDSLYE
jgi:hypothetical protein